MKKVAWVALLMMVIGSGIVGCKKIINSIFPGVDVDVPEMTFSIPAPPSGVPLPPVPTTEQTIGSLTQGFNLDSAVKAKTSGQFGAGDVSSVKIRQIVMTILNSDDQNNFSNFESARLTFASNASQNTPEVDVASFSFPTTNTATMTYVAPDNAPELRQYLNGNKLTYNTYGKLRRYTNKALTVSVKVTMRVK